MDGFMPSEIARLVLGYLKEVKCDETYKSFLSENWDLQEYQRQLNRGKEYPTTYAGKSLLAILDEYYQLKVKGGASSSSRSSERTESSAHSCRTPANKAQPSVVPRTQQIRTKSVVESAHNGDSPPLQPATRSRGRVLPPRNLFSSPHFSPSKSRIRSILRFETPKKSSSGLRSSATSTESHQTESTKQKSFPPASASESDVSVDHISSVDACELMESSYSESASITTTTSSLYINSSVQTCLTFTSTQIGSGTETSVMPQTAPNATVSSVLSSEVSQADNSPNVSSGTGNSSSVVSAKLPEDTCDHGTNSMGKLPGGKYCSGSDATSTVLGNETNSFVVPSSSPASAMTPDTSHEPPPYHRAPATNSPRITLSLERSVVPSLSTPMKQLYGSDGDFRSPNRKKSSIPRRRLISESSPSSKAFPQTDILAPVLGFADEASEQWDRFEQDFMPLINKITENINIVKSSEEISADQQAAEPAKVSPSKTSSTEDVVVPSAMIKNILDRTESDPVFEEYVAYLSERFEASREDCDVNVMFVSPRRPLSTPRKDGNIGTVTRKLLISGGQNQASSAETFGRQCNNSFGNQQQQASREMEVHTSPHYSYDGGGSVAHSIEKESSGHPWNNADTNNCQRKENDQSGKVGNIVGLQQNLSVSALPISDFPGSQSTTRESVGSVNDSRVGSTGANVGTQQTCQSQDTANFSKHGYDLGGSCDKSPHVIGEANSSSAGIIGSNAAVTSDTISPNNALSDICKAAGICPFDTPSKLQNQKSPKYKVMSTTPVKWQAGTSSPKYKSYRLSIAEESRSSPSVIFVPQNTSEVNAVPGGSSAYLIIHTTEGNMSSGNNVINPPPVPAVPPCAEVEMVTIRENQVVSAESSVVPVVSSVPPSQPFSVLGSNTSDETYWMPSSQTVNLTSDIQYVTVVSPGQQKTLSQPVPIAMAPPGHVAVKKYYPIDKKGKRRAAKTKDDAETARIRANIMRDLNLGKKKKGRPRSSRRGSCVSRTVATSTVTVIPDEGHTPDSNQLTFAKCATQNGEKVHQQRRGGAKRTEQLEDEVLSTRPLTRAKSNEQQDSPSKCSTPTKRGKQSNTSNSPVSRAKQDTGEISPSKRARSTYSPKTKTPTRSEMDRSNGNDLKSSVVANFDALKQNASPKLKSLISSIRQHLGTAGSYVRVLNFGPFADGTKPVSMMKKRAGKRELAFARGNRRRTPGKHSGGKETSSEGLVSGECLEVVDLTSPERTSPPKELVLCVPRLPVPPEQKKMLDSVKTSPPLQNSALSNEADKSPLKKRVLKFHAQEILRQQQESVFDADKVEGIDKEPTSLSSSTETPFNPECSEEQTEFGSCNELLSASQAENESVPEQSGLCSRKPNVSSSEQTSCHGKELSQRETTGLATLEKGEEISTPVLTKEKTSMPAGKICTNEDMACVDQSPSESYDVRSPRRNSPLSPTRASAGSKEQTVTEPPAQKSSAEETVLCSPIQGMATVEREETSAFSDINQTVSIPCVSDQEKDHSHSFKQTASDAPTGESHHKEEMKTPTKKRGRSRKEGNVAPLALCSHSPEKAATETPREKLHGKEDGKAETRGSPRKEEKRGRPRKEEKRGRPRKEDKRGSPRKEEKRGRPRKEEKRGRPRKEDKRGSPRKEEKRGRPRKEEISSSLSTRSSKKPISEIPMEELHQKGDKTPVKQRGKPRKEERVVPLSGGSNCSEEVVSDLQCRKSSRRRTLRKEQTTVSLAGSLHSEKDTFDSHCRKSPRKGQPRKEPVADPPTHDTFFPEEHESDSHQNKSPKKGWPRKEKANVLHAGSSHSSEEDESYLHGEELSQREQLRKEQETVSLTDDPHSSEKNVSDSHHKELPERWQLTEEQPSPSLKGVSHSFEIASDVHSKESSQTEQPRKEHVTVPLAESLQSSGKGASDLHHKESPQQGPLRREQAVSSQDKSQKLLSDSHSRESKELLMKEMVSRSCARRSDQLRKRVVSPSQTLYSKRFLERLKREEMEAEADRVENRSSEPHFGRKHINQIACEENRRSAGVVTLEETASNLHLTSSPLEQNSSRCPASGREFRSIEQKTKYSEEQSAVEEISHNRATTVNNFSQCTPVLHAERSLERECSSVVEKATSKSHNEVVEKVHSEDISGIAATVEKQADSSKALSTGKTVNVCCFCCQKIDEISQKLLESVDSTPSSSSIRLTVTTDSSPQMESACTQTENSLDGDNIKRVVPPTSVSLSDNITAEIQMLDSVTQCAGMDNAEVDEYKQDKETEGKLKSAVVDSEQVNKSVDKEGPEKTRIKETQHAKMGTGKVDRAQQSRINEKKVNHPSVSTDKYSEKESSSVSSSKTTERNPLERRGRKRKEPPSIPAGVKLPPKWGVSNINIYSSAINHISSTCLSKRRKCTQNKKDQEQPNRKNLTQVNEDVKKDEPSSKKSPLENGAKSPETIGRKSGVHQLIYSSDESLTQTPENLAHATSCNHTSSNAVAEKEPPPRKIAFHTDSVHTTSEKHPNEHSSTSHNSSAADSSPKPCEDYNEVECAIAYLKETEKESDGTSFGGRDSPSEVGCELTIGKSPSSELPSSHNSSSIFNVGGTKKRKTSSEKASILEEICVSEFLDQIYV